MKHLKEVPIPEADSSAEENVIVEFAKKNKYFIIGTAIASAIAAGIIYNELEGLQRYLKIQKQIFKKCA